MRLVAWLKSRGREESQTDFNHFGKQQTKRERGCQVNRPKSIVSGHLNPAIVGTPRDDLPNRDRGTVLLAKRQF